MRVSEVELHHKDSGELIAMMSGISVELTRLRPGSPECQASVEALETVRRVLYRHRSRGYAAALGR